MSQDDDKPAPSEALERLERELEAERKASADLRAGVHNLQKTVSELRAEMSAQAEGQTPPSADSAGRREVNDDLEQLRRELARVASERDALQQRLARIEGMQTETVSLPDDEPAPAPQEADAPSIDELMASLGEMMEDTSQSRRHEAAASDAVTEGDWQEMLAPELIAPEDYEHRGQPTETDDSGAVPRRGLGGTQLLVLVDSERRIKYPLYKEVMTIGRSDGADIQVDGNYISRIHARVIRRDGGVEVEDAGSKNGVKVNARPVNRQSLTHGDVLGIGVLHFTYLETPDV